MASQGLVYTAADQNYALPVGLVVAPAYVPPSKQLNIPPLIVGLAPSQDPSDRDGAFLIEIW